MRAFNTILLFVAIGLCHGGDDQETHRDGIQVVDGILRIPLVHMESGLQKVLRTGMDLKKIESIYNRHKHEAISENAISKYGKPVPSNDTLPLYKYFDTEYYGLINVGKPGKTFKMLMDTAWAYSWVPSADCPSTSIGCVRHAKYNHKQSSSYIPVGTPFNVTSESDAFIGYMSNDSFLVGQMFCHNQTFGELTHIPWIYALYDSDGVIGLGFKELAPGYTPFFYNFFAQNKLKEPIFSFYVNRDPTTKRGGSIFFGGIDTKHNKTAFTTIQIKPRSYYWTFAMDRVSVIFSSKSKKDFCPRGCNAFADTSSNTIVGPADEIRELNQLIGAQEIFFSDRYLIPCVNEYKGPKVEFTINGKPFQIAARDYIQKLSYSGVTVCLSAFQPASAHYPPNSWSLGGAFLYQYYTAFDIKNKQIFIAEAA